MDFTAGKCCSLWMKISSGLGILFGLSIFFVFSFYYGNDAAGAFGLISAMFAAISLHLVLLYSGNRLMTWYSPLNLKALAGLGLICSTIALSLTMFFAIYASKHGIPIMPVKESYYLVAVWSGMTFKWALTVAVLSFRYARILESSTPFLIIHEHE